MLIGIVGGTGAAGRSLALRFSSLGHQVMLGSRTAEKAKEASHGLLSQDGLVGGISGMTNLQAAGAEMVFIATPWD
ncbi:MAG: NAD(P)-binding domain-containing protein, partial [Acidimicrobiaceae bacterium]|nr:NAD(P)-binding domain-containing protein [Acidimicrobiaceae bacterium]